MHALIPQETPRSSFLKERTSDLVDKIQLVLGELVNDLRGISCVPLRRVSSRSIPTCIKRDPAARDDLEQLFAAEADYSAHHLGSVVRPQAELQHTLMTITESTRRLTYRSSLAELVEFERAKRLLESGGSDSDDEDSPRARFWPTRADSSSSSGSSSPSSSDSEESGDEDDVGDGEGRTSTFKSGSPGITLLAGLVKRFSSVLKSRLLEPDHERQYRESAIAASLQTQKRLAASIRVYQTWLEEEHADRRHSVKALKKRRKRIIEDTRVEELDADREISYVTEHVGAEKARLVTEFKDAEEVLRERIVQLRKQLDHLREKNATLEDEGKIERLNLEQKVVSVRTIYADMLDHTVTLVNRMKMDHEVDKRLIGRRGKELSSLKLESGRFRSEDSVRQQRVKGMLMKLQTLFASRKILMTGIRRVRSAKKARRRMRRRRRRRRKQEKAAGVPGGGRYRVATASRRRR